MRASPTIQRSAFPYFRQQDGQNLLFNFTLRLIQVIRRHDPRLPQLACSSVDPFPQSMDLLALSVTANLELKPM